MCLFCYIDCFVICIFSMVIKSDNPCACVVSRFSSRCYVFSVLLSLTGIFIAEEHPAQNLLLIRQSGIT